MPDKRPERLTDTIYMPDENGSPAWTAFPIAGGFKYIREGAKCTNNECLVGTHSTGPGGDTRLVCRKDRSANDIDFHRFKFCPVCGCKV